jgi:hypothetical protein
MPPCGRSRSRVAISVVHRSEALSGHREGYSWTSVTSTLWSPNGDHPLVPRTLLKDQGMAVFHVLTTRRPARSYTTSLDSTGQPLKKRRPVTRLGTIRAMTGRKPGAQG